MITFFAITLLLFHPYLYTYGAIEIKVSNFYEVTAQTSNQIFSHLGFASNFNNMTQQVNKRDIRQFYLYKDGFLQLLIEDYPGTLNSLGSPGVEGPPKHPFLYARSFDAVSEDEMGKLLRQATSFDNYVELLIDKGYDVVSSDGLATMSMNGGYRLKDEKGLVGVLWKHKGQFSCLWWQPKLDELVFNHATLTVYRKDQAEKLFHQLKSTMNFEELRINLEALGFKLLPVTDE